MIPLRDVIPSRTTPVVTTAIVVANVLVYLREMSLAPRELEAFVQTFGLVPAEFAWTSVFSSMFVHASFMHVAGNMLYLWIFGDNVEDRMGHGRFVAFYLLAGIGAALAQTFAAPDSPVPMVGASGAIAGVMGAYFVLYPRSRVLTLVPFPLTIVEIPAVFLLGLWFLMQFVSGVATLSPAQSGELAGGVAFWAHAAGFGTGVILVFVFRRRERQRVEWWSGPADGRS
ncbi:MAG: rhomboid family intramembrane serine protease [Vicinamibacterales bacterium]